MVIVPTMDSKKWFAMGDFIVPFILKSSLAKEK